MKWNHVKNKLCLLMSILIAVQAFCFTPASHAASTEVNLLTNGSFEEPVYSNAGWYIVNDSNASVAWKTSAPDHNIEIWAHSNGGVSAYNGQQHAELNAYYDSTLYQDVATMPGQVLVWHLSHRGNRGTDVMKLQMGAPGDFTQPSGKTTLSTPEISATNITYTKTTNSTGTSTLSSPYSNSFTMSDGNTEWGYYTGYYIVPEGQTTTRFAFTAVSSATGAPNVGNFMDDVFFGTAGSPPVASGVDIVGTVKTGQTVNGSYTFSDDDGDLESVTGSAYQWYVGSQSDGSDKTPINGATDLTYTIANADYGKYLFFEVTPKAQTGTPTGATVVSSGNLVGGIAPVETNLVLAANPENIVGDGKSTAQLTAALTDSTGKPIPNAEVVFSAPKGTFVGSNRAITNEQGIATIIYKSEQMLGTVAQQIPVTAAVNDPAKGLDVEQTITITYLPVSISGVMTKGNSNEPLKNTTVRVTLDLNGDSKIEAGVDFDEAVVTDDKGAYSVPVPKGDAEYTLTVTQSVNVNGVDTPVTFTQKAKVGQITGVGENFDPEKTVTGIVLLKKPDGNSGLFSNEVISKTKVYLKDSTGKYIADTNGNPKPFQLQTQGVFQADGLTVGDYALEIRYEFEPGKEITMSESTVKVTSDGEMNISEKLIDPYGTITDEDTHSVIEGANVALYYADTKRNRDKGITPHTGVVLPEIEGFAPNNNKSPEQLSDANGFYAFMVFAETDYYIVITKDGYVTKTSDNISVENEIVKRDFELRKSSGYLPGGGGGGSVVTTPDITLNLSVDKNLVKEGDQSTITLNFKNLSTAALSEGEISITIPEGAELVNAYGGTVNGRTVTWKVSNLAIDQEGSFKITVKWAQLTAADAEFEFPAQFTANGNAAAKEKSNVKVNVYSDRFGDLKHQRYILGYPDGQFKPNNSLTRAELAAIVARLTENDQVSDTLSYTDVPEGHWAANYVKIATKYGYFTGFDDGSFRPEASVTRGELASVMTRFLKLNVNAAVDTHFSDVKDHWAGDAIEALYRNKFLTGYEDGTFKPQEKISRAEAVTMINRMLYRGPLKGLAPQFPDMPESHWAFGDVQEATVSHESVRNEDGSETWKKTIEDEVN